MLSQDRLDEITRLVNRDGSATVLQLAQALDTSESTIRRDLLQLDKIGKIRKVHGGATATTQMSPTQERNMQEKYRSNIEEKRTIAAYAATLIHPFDLVFIDSGSTTEQLAEYIEEKDAMYVTNGITLAQKLAARGFKTMLIPGMVKTTTDAVIGGETIAFLEHYHFSIGFFGVNGITTDAGYTTPDIEEARNKRTALKHCRASYVLADTSKFNFLSSVTFGNLEEAAIITVGRNSSVLTKYKEHTEVIEL